MTESSGTLVKMVGGTKNPEFSRTEVRRVLDVEAKGSEVEGRGETR